MSVNARMGWPDPGHEKLVVDGTTFVRLHGDKRLSQSGAIEVRRPSGRETFIVKIDMEVVRGRLDKWKRFRTAENAMRAGVKELAKAEASSR